jgi:hypothetical protein
MQQIVLLLALTLLEPKSSNPTPPSLPKAADISINGLSVHDSTSVATTIGGNVDVRRSDSSDVGYGPLYAAYLSEDKAQILVLGFHPGRSTNEFDEVLVRPAAKNEQLRFQVLKGSKYFVSGKGVRLGLTKQQVVAILGVPLEEAPAHGLDVARYKFTFGATDSVFLDRYSMPEYDGTYYFKRKRLVEFKFGFPYP